MRKEILASGLTLEQELIVIQHNELLKQLTEEEAKALLTERLVSDFKSANKPCEFSAEIAKMVEQVQKMNDEISSC
jgi:hypothetical protein